MYSGASAILLGRPILWGLTYDGVAGVSAVLESLHAELVYDMRSHGAKDLKAIRDLQFHS